MSKLPQYYYTVTGDVVQGDNKTSQEYTSYTSARFPLGEPGDIVTQMSGWEKPIEGEISPLYEAVPGMLPAAFTDGKSTPNAYNA